MSTLGERVRVEREAREWSQTQLAERVSAIVRRKITQVSIHHTETRNSGATNPRYIVELAQALEVRLSWLQHGRGPKKDEPEKTPRLRLGDEERLQTPVRHYVGAGDEVYMFDQGGDDDAIEWEPAPPGFDRQNGSAVIVRGESMQPLYDPGDLLFFRHRRNPPMTPKDLPLRPVIVQIKEGPLYVKKLLPGTRRGLFHLLSVNPRAPVLHDQAVESFAYIEWVKPRMV
tara:strand:- start:414 stop:1100 length:687 start_codon:yes stop_codon:yes gene_type:complete